STTFIEGPLYTRPRGGLPGPALRADAVPFTPDGRVVESARAVAFPRSSVDVQHLAGARRLGDAALHLEEGGGAPHERRDVLRAAGRAEGREEGLRDRARIDGPHVRVHEQAE